MLTWIVLTQQAFTDHQGRTETETFWDRRSYETMKAAVNAGALLGHDDFFIGKIENMSVKRKLVETVSPHNSRILEHDLSKIEKQIYL